MDSNDEEKIVKDTISESIQVKEKTISQSDVILQISKNMVNVLKKGGTIFLFGNGGSAADAQHVAAELVGRFAKERKALSAEAFTTNTSILSAIGNDYDFSEIFARQVKARVKPDDLVVGISTSGRSKNVVKGLSAAREIGAKTISFTGSDPRLLKEFSDICFCAPSDSTPRIQESHIMVWHIICDIVEKNF